MEGRSHLVSKDPYCLSLQDLFAWHYLSSMPGKKIRFLYTPGLTDCVGIVFIHRIKGIVQKLGIYHSNGEHHCEKEDIELALSKKTLIRSFGVKPNNLILAIQHFLSDISDLANITIVIHDSKFPKNGYQQNYRTIDSFRHIKELIDSVSTFLNKGTIPDCHFRYHQGGRVFCVMHDGSYYGLPLKLEECEPITKNLATYIFDEIAMTACRGSHFWQKTKYTAADKMMIEEMNKARAKEITWVEACIHIKVILEERSPKEKKKKPYEHIHYMFNYFDQLAIPARFQKQLASASLQTKSLPFLGVK